MKAILIGVVILAGLFLLALATSLYLIARPMPPITEPKDVFDFAILRKPPSDIDPPSLRRYPARDGEQLAYRIYPSTAERILIFVHGSSYHGLGYHGLAASLSLGGAAMVVLPNVRGHYQSGRHRGDVEYIGQLEDDIADLIAHLRAQGHTGPITLGGHSSGAGFVIRFAGGPHAGLVTSHLLLAPAIPVSGAMRRGDGGGWANLHFQRLYGLVALNTIGIHGFDGLEIIEFNKPAKYWDGTETLAYSHRLNVSYHPRFRYQNDLHALGPTLMMIGANDEAIDPEAMRSVFAANAPKAQVMIVPELSHFGIFNTPAPWDTMAAWLRTLPGGADGK